MEKPPTASLAQALETWLMTQWENQVLETLETQA